MQRIVCAANKHKEFGDLILGVRHWDRIMHDTFSELNSGNYRDDPLQSRDFIQGFIDNKGNFLDRKEAYIVAKEANQIIKKTGPENSEELYSEDLY